MSNRLISFTDFYNKQNLKKQVANLEELSSLCLKIAKSHSLQNVDINDISTLLLLMETYDIIQLVNVKDFKQVNDKLKNLQSWFSEE